LVAGEEEGRWSPHRFRVGRTITFGEFLSPDKRFFDSIGIETCSNRCLAFGLGQEGDWLLEWRPFCLMGFWGVCCFDLATAMALGSVGVDAGRGEGGARRGGGVESAGNRARVVLSSGVTTLGVVVVSISEVVAGGLVVSFNCVSKQYFTGRDTCLTFSPISETILEEILRTRTKWNWRA
jgi:hypothetical protein